MVRNILAAIAGYVAMFVVIFVTFSVAFFMIGVEGSYQPGSYDVSFLWIVVSLILSILAAVLGGFVCKLIARNDTAVKILAGLVLVLGLIMWAFELGAERTTEMRAPDVAVMEAMEKSVQPPWVGLAVTVLGVVGVLYGGRLKQVGGE